MTLSGERGSAVVGFGLIIVLLMFMFGVGMVGAAAASYATAASAADSAALAAAPVTFLPFGAAGSPTNEAVRFARANGATLVSCRCPVDRSWNRRTVSVTVSRSISLPIIGTVTVHSTSRATFDPAKLLDLAVPTG